MSRESKIPFLILPSTNNFRDDLLSWYDRNKRLLPWRENPSPYRVWVSEIMLQQTTVSTVIPYFERFLRRFPSLERLAASSEEDVLAAWAGLGYYSRARNLRASAQKIVKKRAGKFPDDFESLMNLPGIGRYTAGAILSIAFQKPYSVLDGNVKRVFSRFLAANREDGHLWNFADELLDLKRPGDWNQALMELGRTLCLPENPDCGSCPVHPFCLAFQRGSQDQFPAVQRARPFEKIRWTFLWIEKRGRVLIWKRSSDEKLLKNHWGLPEARRFNVRPGGVVKKVRHTIMRYKIDAVVRKAPAPMSIPRQARWVLKKDLELFLLSSLWKKCF